MYCLGKGENISRYKQKVRFQNNIIFRNKRIENEEVGIFFETAAMVVLPYIEATQSGVIPLAYAYSKPVIATNVGSIPAVVIHNQTGILIEPHSVEYLVKKIIYLVRNVNKRKEMGHNAYNFAMQELSWDKIAEKVVKLFGLNK